MRLLVWFFVTNPVRLYFRSISVTMATHTTESAEESKAINEKGKKEFWSDSPV